ncbi:unnamed protein product, partial [marine sediment metagenome]
KHSIAWFKLAECIAKGERERALGVYRLLSHSLNNTALAKQLEADLFLAFNDHQRALQLYKIAAQLYKQQQSLYEAAAVYEHMLTIQSDNEYIRTTVIELFDQLDITSKVAEHLKNAVRCALEQKKFDVAREYTKELERRKSLDACIDMGQQLVCALIADGSCSRDIICSDMRDVIDHLVAHDKDTRQ